MNKNQETSPHPLLISAPRFHASSKRMTYMPDVDRYLTPPLRSHPSKRSRPLRRYFIVNLHVSRSLILQSILLPCVRNRNSDLGLVDSTASLSPNPIYSSRERKKQKKNRTDTPRQCLCKTSTRHPPTWVCRRRTPTRTARVTGKH